MRDEIKEILDFDFTSQGERIEINEYERDILKDYITNLQRENDYYFKKNNELSTLNTSLRSDRDNYKSRVEKATDKLYCYGEVFNSKILQDFQREMLNILQGGKDE